MIGLQSYSLIGLQAYLKDEVGVQQPHPIDVVRVDKKWADATERIAPRPFPERERITKRPIRQSSKDDVHGVFDHDVHLVFRCNHSSFQETETWSKRSSNMGTVSKSAIIAIRW